MSPFSAGSSQREELEETESRGLTPPTSGLATCVNVPPPSVDRTTSTLMGPEG